MPARGPAHHSADSETGGARVRSVFSKTVSGLGGAGACLSLATGRKEWALEGTWLIRAG